MTEETTYWRGDLVRVINPGQYDRGLWFISYPPDDGDVGVGIVSSLHGSYTHRIIDLDRIQLVARGNYYRLAHGLPMSFGSITRESEFWVELGLMKEVPYDFDGLFVWSAEQALEALTWGEIDAAFWVTGPHYPNGDTTPSLYGYLCLLPEVAERMRGECLDFLTEAIARQAATS